MSVWAGAPQEHAVALTFADRPSGAIAALLQRYGTRGTFFVPGNHAEESPGGPSDSLPKPTLP